MPEQAHHTVKEDTLYVDSAFVRAFSANLRHLGFGDFETIDKSVRFIRRDGSVDAPDEFVGRIHLVYCEGNLHAPLIAAASSKEV